MQPFLGSLLLALTWCLATGNLGLGNLVVGLVLGHIAIGISRAATGKRFLFARTILVARFVVFYLWELILSSLRVAFDVVTPEFYTEPGIIAVPLDAETDVEITILAHLISLTPGNLSLGVSNDRRVLYVHVMFLDNPDEARAKIKDDLERRVLQVLR